MLAGGELVEQAGRMLMGAGEGSVVVSVGEEGAGRWSPRDSESWRTSPVSGSNALYAVFTSGSTGKPKGVVNEHGAFSSAALASGKFMGIDSQSRHFHFASHAFDMTIMDYLRTWIFWGCVCVASEEQLRDDLGVAMSSLRANCFANLVGSG